MTVLALFGYGLIAFGPVGAFFVITVARQPHEVILMIAGAFFWLLSLFLSSLWWIIVPPLRHIPAYTLPISVILQELFRYLYFRLVKRADKVFELLYDDKTSRRKHKIAYVCGMGFGVVSGIIAFSNVLKESGGPAIVGINDGGSQFFVLASAFGTNIMIFLHICWGVLWFDGWEKPKTWLGMTKIVSVFVTHMLVSCLSLLNDPVSPIYFLVVAHIVFLVMVTFALITAGLKTRNIQYFFYIK